MESHLVGNTLDHLALSWLLDLKSDELYSGRFDTQYEESDDQRQRRHDITRHIWSEVNELCLIENVRELRIPWFESRQQQQCLKSAVENNLTEDWLHRLILNRWDEVREARAQGMEIPRWYEKPPVLIEPGRGRKHHLVALRPYHTNPKQDGSRGGPNLPQRVRRMEYVGDGLGSDEQNVINFITTIPLSLITAN